MAKEVKRRTKRAKDRDVIPLEDLAPRHDVRGGAGGIIFGQQTGQSQELESTLDLTKGSKKISFPSHEGGST